MLQPLSAPIGKGRQHSRIPFKRNGDTIMEMTLDNDTWLEDQRLMDGVLRRLPDALERLHKRYRVVLKSIIMQVLHDETESDDVLQEVFLQVWDRAHSYSSRKGKLMSWLCTLARRRAIDRLRQQSAYRRATTVTRCLAMKPARMLANRTPSSTKPFVTTFVRCCASTWERSRQINKK